MALGLWIGVCGCATLEVQPAGGTFEVSGESMIQTETRDCVFRAALQQQEKGKLTFDVEIKNVSTASWPVGPNRILLSGAGVNQRVISAVDSDLEIALLRKELGRNQMELVSVKKVAGKELMMGLMPGQPEKSERSQVLEKERLALRDQLEKKVSFLEIDIAEIERSRLFKSVLAPQKNARGRVEFQTSVSEGDLLLTAECHRTSAVLRFRVVKR
ncbi:MAG: hypothetical protein K2X47_18785 [Bdellovibrionales bacterium]|nr:hypothetical protein [Bdellovibrionales bacterium]